MGLYGWIKERGGGVIYVLEEWVKSHDVLSWSDQDFQDP